MATGKSVGVTGDKARLELMVDWMGRRQERSIEVTVEE
jgi:hypothetical protein